jgi:chaperonin GroES
MAKDCPLSPLDERVVLIQESAEETTASGFILPESAQEKPKVYEIVNIGPGKRLENGETRPMQVKVGQRVVCSQYAGDDIKINEVDYKVISEDSLLAIVN